LSDFISITEPVKICEIDFSGHSEIPYNEFFSHNFVSAEKTDSVVVFFWWNIHMTRDKDLTLSCAPHWAHQDTNHQLDEVNRRNLLPFRDHWMQGCYFIPRRLEKGTQYALTATHDEFSWFFDVCSKSIKEKMERPICNCIFHMCNSRNRIMQINDESKRSAFMEMMKQTALKNVLFIGDHTLLSLIACHDAERRITVLQEDELCFRSMKKFIACNGLENKVQIIDDLCQIQSDQFTHVIAEPYFQSAVLPIDNICEIWRIVTALRALSLKPFRVSPLKAKIFAVPVHFLHLYKIRWPLKSTCEGFDHECFDKVIERASEIADENVEAFALWEYPCVALGRATDIFEVNFNEDRISERVASVDIDNFSKSCNGVAFWIEWILDEHVNGAAFSTGPSKPIETGELINWKFDRQAVHLIPHGAVVRGILSSVEIKSQFDAIESNISLDFSYNYE
jgi:hypothetical protein